MYCMPSEPVCCEIDSWARGMVPEFSEVTNEDTTPPSETSTPADEVLYMYMYIHVYTFVCVYLHVHVGVHVHSVPHVC